MNKLIIVLVLATSIAHGADVLGVGDSIAKGSPGYPTDESSQIWHHLSNTLSITYANEGVNSSTSRGVDRRIQGELDLYKPSYVVVHVGINDIATDVDIDAYLSNMDSIVKKCRGAGAYVIVGEILPCSNYSNDVVVWNAELYKWAKKNKVRFAETHGGMTDRELYADSVHPNAEGYAVLACLYAKSFLPKLDIVDGEVSYNTLPGKTYELQYSSNLVDWVEVPDDKGSFGVYRVVMTN